MIIYPAIDIIDGKCVRLSRGDYSKKKTYSSDLLATAQKWVSLGATHLHIVDLDGAKEGHNVNFENIKNIRNAFPDLFIQVGGGIRSNETLNTYLQAGVDRLILGTKVLNDDKFIQSIDDEYKGKIAIDVAIKDGKLSGDGWEIPNERDVSEFIFSFEEQGITTFIITDIGRDGMMQGVNINNVNSMLENITTKAIISGGVTSLQDIKNINQLSSTKIDGIIIGKALYEGTINLNEAIDECSK